MNRYEEGIEVLRLAETLIRSEGWCKDELIQKNGSYCLIGAIAEATNTVGRLDRSVCLVAHGLSDDTSLAYKSARYSVPRCKSPHSGQLYKPGLVGWNDGFCTSERQARALLRLARLHLRREYRSAAP